MLDEGIILLVINCVPFVSKEVPCERTAYIVLWHVSDDVGWILLSEICLIKRIIQISDGEIKRMISATVIYYIAHIHVSIPGDTQGAYKVLL